MSGAGLAGAALLGASGCGGGGSGSGNIIFSMGPDDPDQDLYQADRQVQQTAQGRVPGHPPRDARRHGAVFRQAEDRVPGRGRRHRRHRGRHHLADPVRRAGLGPGPLRQVPRLGAEQVPARSHRGEYLRRRDLRGAVVRGRGTALLPQRSPRAGRLLRAPRDLGRAQGDGPQDLAGHGHPERLRLPGKELRGRGVQRSGVHQDPRRRCPLRA